MATDRPEVVVITGASAGVGRAAVREFARRGAHVALLARGEAGLEGARREVEELGGRPLAIPTDVADAAQVEAAAEKAEEELGPIDIWVNNAMTSVFAPLTEIEPEEFKRTTEVCYLGFVYGTMAALKRMKPRDRGTIVQVGSALAYRAIPLQSAYCGAKHAIHGFTESVRTELLHDKSNVHITAVHMPALNTPQFSWVRSRLPRKPQPVPPIYHPEVAAGAIYWAAHHRRRELHVGFNTAVIIHGNKVAPGLGDWYLARTGYEGQQYDGPPEPGREDNLFSPVGEDRGARGEFTGRSRPHSRQLWVTMHRRGLAAAAGGVMAAGIGLAKWMK